MNIPIFLIVVLFFVAFLFLTPYRQAVIDLVAAGWNVIAGLAIRLWNVFRVNATPRRLGTLGVVVVVVALAAVFLPYALVGAGVVTIGAIVGKTWVAVLLVAILMVMGVVFSLPGLAIFRSVQWANRWILWPAAVCLVGFLLISAAWWGFGKFSPDTQRATERAAKCQATETANWLDKRSLQSEKEAGIFARVSDCRVYNESGQSITSLKDEDLVYVVSTEGKEKTMDGEGMTLVMLPNQNGDFVGGQRGWIPSRNINWDWDKKDKEVSPTKTETAYQDKDIREPIQTVEVGRSEFPQQIYLLLEGEHRIDFQPPEAANEAKILVLQADGEKTEVREISNNCISIGKEEKGYAIWTKVPSVVSISR